MTFRFTSCNELTLPVDGPDKIPVLPADIVHERLFSPFPRRINTAWETCITPE